MAQPIIQIKDLNFYYGSSHALHNINTEFIKNQVTCIVGQSGSGKSTLLRVLNRIYELNAKHRATGHVVYNEKNILDKNIDLCELRTQIGMVFQKPTPFPMSIFENIAFPLKTHYKMDKAELKDRVKKALEQAALWDEVKEKLHKAGTFLSGGQQQRLCIARTIAIKPDVLLLDEPTSALDPIAGKKIEDLIHKLKQQYTIVMVSHNLARARAVADKLIVMHQGRLIEQGPTEALFTSPQHAITADYLQKPQTSEDIPS